MSDGTKRNSDKLNTLGIVVVGVCGAVLAYVSIAFLQAFYMNDSSDVQTMADYGGQDTEFQRIRADEYSHITQCANVMGGAGGGENKHSIPVDHAMRLVVEDARRDAAMLVPVFGRADKPTIKAQFDRPIPLTTPAPAAPADPAVVPAPADGSTTPPPATSGAVAPAPTGGTVPAGAATTTPAPAAPAAPTPAPAPAK